MNDLRPLHDCLALCRRELLSRRRPEGYWEGHLTSSALSTATAVCALSLAAHPQDREPALAGLCWLARTQNDDGGWGDTEDSPSNLATSLLALCALRLGTDAGIAAGELPSSRSPNDPPPPLDESVSRARTYISSLAGETEADLVAAIRAAYGADRTFAVPILTTCALAGLVKWSHVPPLPFELAAFPRGLYSALQLRVVSYALPALIAVGLAIDHHSPRGNRLQRHLRRTVIPTVRSKLLSLQPDNGGFLEAPPLTAFVAMSLVPVFGPEDPVVIKCLEFLRSAIREDGSWPIDSNLSVWVTTGALGALRAARASGHSDGEDAGALEAAVKWTAHRQTTQVHAFTGAAAGGFPWSHLPGAVPDADDTAGAVLALCDGEHAPAVTGGVTWLLNLQNPDGGFPTFCRGWGKLPFDQSCADITAHALRALHAAWPVPEPRVRRAISRALRYLARVQRPDGAWRPLWFGNQYAPEKANPVLGTARVLVALSRLDREGDMARRGLDYLAGVQNPDGGWGGAAQVPSTVEETALAVCALSCRPEQMSRHLQSGAEYLMARVHDGTWTQAAPIGLYFSQLWYAEALYPIVWTTEALARVAAVLGQQ